MSFDRIQSKPFMASAPFGGPVSNAGFKSAFDSQGLYQGVASSANRVLNDVPLTELWEDKATVWGTRVLMGELTDQFAPYRTHISTGNPALQQLSNQADDLLAQALQGKSAPVVNASPSNGGVAVGVKTYADVFRLGTSGNIRTIPISDFQWDAAKKTVLANTSDFRKAIRPGAGRFFLLSWQDYAKQTLWENNIKPLKDLKRLLSGQGAEAKMGASIAGAAGLGLLGFSIARTTRQAYKNAQAEEDGTTRSKIKTWLKAGEAFLKKAFKAATVWEVAGIGCVFGKALIPLTVVGVPVGGILLGALLGALIHKPLDKLLPDPPEQPDKTPAANPFQGAQIA